MMKTFKSELLDEHFYEINHKSGLKIVVFPKEKCTSTYAIFGTKYGSIDNCFRKDKDGPIIKVPEGIAHFLEHKLFESDEVDAFARFSQTGAMANAYTSFDKTCYLFECSDNFNENLKILLDFVTHPYFTAETVQKEQGIIGEEIQMYYDSPEWMSSFNLLRCLYMNHPVKIDIAGTKETIAEIDDKMLYQCYDIFYNLHNMVLVVVGNVDVDNVVSICDENLKEAPEFTAVRIFENEPDEIIKSYEECHIDVGVPVFSFGYKEKCEEPEQSLKKICEIDILLEILIGKASHLYSSLIDKGLINENFSKEYFIGNGYECIMFEGESNSPEEVVCEIKNEIKRLQQDGIDDEIFESVYRDQYGREIMGYNDIEELANMYISGYFSGYNPLDVFDILKDLKKEDIEKHLTTMFRDDKSALSVVKAK